jgi:hypothetical protein
MKKNFPWLSLSIGILLSLALHQFSPLDPQGEAVLPLLASLFMSEVGALMTVYAVFLGVRELVKGGMRFQGLALALGNLLLLLNFAYIGLELWAKSQLAG